ncbi:hypothetical protein acsn021_24640 [Anaerocolumna cellulosilytica]|uniref:Uncharacterized protein n=1 Tax=Anaerocolumna cellulosilytica TaxID=433286 RepID=A0A6S6R6G5_9FIRM|nr:hypothetical protein [Anaerocolumna cellulosilytica]MBB5193889.1 hypothetical protein [Anaerocolumna cellulosilytica]BCJ94895.1 hypothetical protein acsn021_24640 [Anaerocolumna cellulosilytica]
MKGLYSRYNKQKNCIDVTVYEAGYISIGLQKKGRWSKGGFEYTGEGWMY